MKKIDERKTHTATGTQNNKCQNIKKKKKSNFVSERKIIQKEIRALHGKRRKVANNGEKTMKNKTEQENYSSSSECCIFYVGFKGRVVAHAVSRWLPTAAAWVRARSGHVAFVVDKVALGQVFSEYFDFPCQSSFHQILHPHNHPGQVQ
jgi:hypothetical protein